MASLKTWLGFGACGLIAALAGTSSGCGSDAGSSNRDATTAAVCGNGIVEEGEDCDEGAGNNIDGSGCDSDCTFSCTADAECDDRNLCNGFETCNLTLHRCQMGTPPAVGTECTYENDVVSLCIGQICAKPCTDSDEECNDGNPCNGEETCNLELQGCNPGVPLECDDGLECTVDACDPEENPETGCVHTLVDEDGDGYAPEHLDCDDRGGDCNDANPDIHPGADRICGDGIDNNCLGYTHDEGVPIWYQDCDGDTYAPSGALAIESCTKPATTAECLDWTQRTPTGSITTTDCDDSNAAVYPGARNATNNGWYTRPYCRNTGQLATGSAGTFNCSSGILSWDYDCNGLGDKRYTNVNYTSGSSCLTYYIPGPIVGVTLDGAETAGIGEEPASSGAVHKSTLWSDPEETGLIGICDPCANWCGTSGGYTASWSPSCGFQAEWRQCTGTQSCTCTGCSCTCNTTLSQRMQECR
jgi:hypothetical protein